LNPRALSALWPSLLWLAACLFLGDVAVRRIALDVDWIKRSIAEEWRKLRGQEPATASEYMDKLKSRKAEVDLQLDRSKSSARTDAPPIFMPEEAPEGPLGEPILEGAAGEAARVRQEEKAARPSLAVQSPETEKQSYTNRLLRAKQRVWEEREKDNDGLSKKP
jgi:hypothetical protein